MKLTAVVKDIRTRYIAKFGLPRGTPETIDDIARTWCIQFAEQVRFETKDARYGMKRADPGRPIGKDSLAYNADSGLICWDLFTGTGTGTPQLNTDPDSLDIPDQVFVPVPAVDHLGGAAPMPVPPAGHTLQDYLTIGHAIDDLYAAELNRRVSDAEAMTNWIFHWREEGASLEMIRDWIRQSAEWKTKHPNG